jgi:hypothetical protein
MGIFESTGIDATRATTESSILPEVCPMTKGLCGKLTANRNLQ